MRRAEEEEPEPRRSKSGDTEKGFGRAARMMMRRVAGIPPAAYAAAAGYLFATLDWLNPFENEAANIDEFDNTPENADTHDYSLHL